MHYLYMAALVQHRTSRFRRDGSYSYIQTWNSKPLQINNQGNNVLFNVGGGSVGIGTTSPSAQLHLYNSSHGGDLGIGQQGDATPYMRLGMDSGYTQIWQTTLTGQALLIITLAPAGMADWRHA